MGPLFGDRRGSRRLYRFVSRFYDTLRPLFAGFPKTREAYYRYRPIAPGDRVLDIGCGTGESTREVPTHAGALHGIDLSPDQVRMTEQKPDLDRANFVIGDAMSLPYQAETFDVVSSAGSIQHVPDLRAALAEAHRVTVPGGRLFVVGPKRPDSFVGGSIADTLMHFMEPEETKQVVRESGWESVDIHSVHMDYLARDAVVVTGTA